MPTCDTWWMWCAQITVQFNVARCSIKIEFIASRAHMLHAGKMQAFVNDTRRERWVHLTGGNSILLRHSFVNIETHPYCRRRSTVTPFTDEMIAFVFLSSNDVNSSCAKRVISFFKHTEMTFALHQLTVWSLSIRHTVHSWLVQVLPSLKVCSSFVIINTTTRWEASSFHWIHIQDGSRNDGIRWQQYTRIMFKPRCFSLDM